MSSIFNSFFNLDKENREPSEIKYKNEYKEDDGIVKAKLNVQGVVQGVGFRFTTKKLADQLDVHGIVRNESDGSVYIEAVSKKIFLMSLFLKWLKVPHQVQMSI